MAQATKSQKEMLKKLGVTQLNPMQLEAQAALRDGGDLILLSPTGTGKTLAFLLPVLTRLNPELNEVQALILVPSRELAMQVEQVVRDMGTGYKVNSVYGGQPVAKDKINLRTPPAILVGTPGRVADHFRRETFSPEFIENLILDEFDKSLEIGFEDDMSAIIGELPNVQRRILTSATQGLDIPDFVGLNRPYEIDFLAEQNASLTIKMIISPNKDKLETLVRAIYHLGDQPGIVFCNFRDSIERVSEFLEEEGIAHGCFHGGMEQVDREKSLIQFRNGTHKLIVATDLAARGLDIPEIQFIIHYHLPSRAEEFTHRNGRTARMNREGTAYVLKYEREELPDFIPESETEILRETYEMPETNWETLQITGGRRDKISKGDIAGLFMKQGGLKKEELGVIELKQDRAFVAVDKDRADEVIDKLDNQRLKKRKIRINRA